MKKINNCVGKSTTNHNTKDQLDTNLCSRQAEEGAVTERREYHHGRPAHLAQAPCAHRPHTSQDCTWAVGHVFLYL